jgi:hypothetical protein
MKYINWREVRARLATSVFLALWVIWEGRK